MTYLVGTGELILAWYFWKTNSGDRIRKTMVLLVMSVGLWVIFIAHVAYAPAGNVPPVTVDLTYFLGILMVTTLLLLSFLFPYPTIRLDWLHYTLLYTPVIIFSAFLFFGDSIVSGFISSPNQQGYWTEGSMFWIYGLYLIILFIFSLINLVRKYRRSDGIHRINLRLVIWSLLLGGSPAVWLYLISPLFTGKASYPLVGTSLTVFWLGITSYILVRK